MNFLTEKPNAVFAVEKLLDFLSINIEPIKIENELEKHPDYPSLLAVSDVLDSLDIDNTAYRLDADELSEIPMPFLAHTYSNGGELLLVKNINNNTYYVSNSNKNNHKLNSEEFKKIYSGVIMAIENRGGPRAPVKFSAFFEGFKTPMTIALALLVFLSAIVFNTRYFYFLSWPILLLTLIKTAGLVTAILLLIQSIDSNNPLVQRLCKSGGGKTDCNAILSSNAANVFNGLSWSDVGFFYFAGTFLLLLFGNNSLLSWQLLVLLNFISLPYTFYSIYYQARIAKQWCVFCCAVQALLWLEFGVLIFKLNNVVPLKLSWDLIPTAFICLLLPVVIWLIVKPSLLKLQKLQPLKDQLRRFKYNAELFDKILKEQPKYATPDEEWSIVLGNTDAENIITMVTNPYCPPCSKTHFALDELLLQNPGLQARIIFVTNNTDTDIKTPVSRHFMALNELTDKTKVKTALHDWYNQKQKSYEDWSKIYPVEINETASQKLDQQKAWCQFTETTFTPTILINGYRLPNLYQLSDLKYMLV